MGGGPQSPARAGAPSIVEVDARRFRVRLGAPGEALEVETSTGAAVRLEPWVLTEHLPALERWATIDGEAMHLDHEGLARDVLARSGVEPALFDELWPLSLWWAAGGDAGAPPALAGWVQAGHARARLRPWTFAERAEAIHAAVTARPDGSRALRLDRYLAAMITASVVAMDPPEAAPLSGTTALLDAVAALNAVGGRAEDGLLRAGGEGGRALAEATLRLCGALGWTPSQVWSAPAVEVDRLLALLALTGRAPDVGPRPASLADHPDAVVIHVEDG
jgi:hypothetical protein